MANGYTVFATYLLKPTDGYSPAVHCNYIQSLFLDTTIPDIEEVRMIFPDISAFKFLSTGLTSGNGGTGYTANYLYAVIQLVNNSGFTSTSDVKPDASKWKIFDLTPQIPGHVSGSTITPSELISVVFKVALNTYNNPLIFIPYELNNIITGLQYPTRYVNEDKLLCFGDEMFFLGNVTAEIHADVYTTNLSIMLPANQFNSSTNATWDSTRDLSVYATEVGVYDGNGNLVAIGKFNDPVEKNANIARTILFAIDF